VQQVNLPAVILKKTILFPRESQDMAQRADSRTYGEFSRPVLTIDAVAAEVVVSPGQADELFAWFQGQGVQGDLQRRRGLRGRDVIDFGNPTPAEERRIRRLFAEWERRKR
jgi:hypothetical protein